MIKDTNPDHYKVEGANFIEYMNDPKISGFGNWMFANGFNFGVLAATNWINVKDDLPKEHDSIFANHTHLSKHMWAKESDNVIVYVRFPDGTGRSTEGRLQDGKWWTRVSPMLEPVVTHWMPLPEPPKEDKDDALNQWNPASTYGSTITPIMIPYICAVRTATWFGWRCLENHVIWCAIRSNQRGVRSDA